MLLTMPRCFFNFNLKVLLAFLITLSTWVFHSRWSGLRNSRRVSNRGSSEKQHSRSSTWFSSLCQHRPRRPCQSVFRIQMCSNNRYQPRVGPGHPSSPLVHLLPHLFPFSLFPFFHWLYLFSSFVHPFPFYQNSRTPFPGRRW